MCACFRSILTGALLCVKAKERQEAGRAMHSCSRGTLPTPHAVISLRYYNRERGRRPESRGRGRAHRLSPEERVVSPLIPLIIILPMLSFYIWMFWDMMHNNDLTTSPWALLGARGINSLDNFRYNWMTAFLLFNVFAAAMYYVWEYRRR